MLAGLYVEDLLLCGAALEAVAGDYLGSLDLSGPDVDPPSVYLISSNPIGQWVDFYNVNPN